METPDNPAPKQVRQFRDISEADQRVINRLHTDRQAPKAPTKVIDTAAINHVFRNTLRSAADVRNIFAVMPDLNLPREMLVSAICAPGDLASTSLIINNGMGGGSSPLTAAIIDALDQFHIKEQGLAQKVPNWIDDALIISGAHPIMIIPEASIDQMISGNGPVMSLESIASYGGEYVNGWYRPKGWLGLRLPTADSASYISFESAKSRVNSDAMADYHTIKAAPKSNKTVALPFRVTDNLAVFRKPAVNQLKQRAAMDDAYGTPSLEARRRKRLEAQAKDGNANVPTTGEIYSRYFKPPQAVKRNRLEVIPTLKQSGGKTFGHPLVYHLAVESVIPVAVPGDETNHVGYIVILDQNGYPVSYSRRLNFYDDVRRGGMADGSAVAGELIQMSKETIQGGTIAGANNHQLDRLAQLHSDVIESDLVARLKAGMMEGDFELTRTEHVDRLLFARSMKNQMTTLLYVPADLMIYFAFDYNEFGIGKSIMEDAKPMAAMRATLTVANVIGSAKAAIPGKDVNIELEPDDNDPVGTATFMAQEALNLNYQDFPMTVMSPMGIADRLQSSNMSFNISGNPRYPDVKTTVTARENSFTPVNQDLMRDLRDDLTRVFSLTPETVDGSSSPDFATTVVNNNLMLLKRVMSIQGLANPQITDYVRTFTLNSGYLIDQLMDLVENNRQHLPDEYKENPESYLEDFLNCLQVKLPAPENDSLEAQLKAFEDYSKMLDTVISQAYLRDEFMDGYSTELQREALPSLMASWKGERLRKFMRDRGMFRELDIFGNDENGSPIMDMLHEANEYIKSMKGAVGPYMEKAAKDALDRKKENERLAVLDSKAKAALVSPPAEETPAGTTDELNDGTGGEENVDNNDDGSLDDQTGDNLEETSGEEGGEAGNAETTDTNAETGDVNEDDIDNLDNDL